MIRTAISVLTMSKIFPTIESADLWSPSHIAQSARFYRQVKGLSWDEMGAIFSCACAYLDVPELFKTRTLYKETKVFLIASGLKRIQWLPLPHRPRIPSVHPRLLDKPTPEMQAEMERLRREDPILYGDGPIEPIPYSAPDAELLSAIEKSQLKYGSRIDDTLAISFISKIAEKKAIHSFTDALRFALNECRIWKRTERQIYASLAGYYFGGRGRFSQARASLDREKFSAIQIGKNGQYQFVF
jgi:hypothetical protein